MFSIKKTPINSKFTLILLYVLTFINIASFGFPIICDLILILLLKSFIKKNKLISLNTNLILILSVILATFVFKNKDEKNFYRGHEKFFKNDNSYKVNVNETIDIPHGDIIAVDVCINDANDLIQKRQQIFITDDYGFRNSKVKLKNADLILVGDSIVSGSGLSDKDILSNQINSKSNFKAANISVGGVGPVEYESMLLKYLKTIDKDSKIFIFYFEGNDFEISNTNIIPKYSYNNIKINKYKYKIRFGYERLERNKDKFFVKILNYKNIFYKKIRPKSQRFYKRSMLKWTNTCEVQYDLINKKLTGFLWTNRNKEYIYKTHIINNPEILKSIDKVFFVPTKSTVYEKYTKNIINYESNKFFFLQKSYSKKNIDVVDLTLPLKLNIKKYLLKDSLLFFKDDTHLNKYGISVLADYILDQSL